MAMGTADSFPPDRARRSLADESTSVARNSETTIGQSSVDVRVSRLVTLGKKMSVEAMFEVFNLFNRANFFEDTNQSSFVIFGRAHIRRIRCRPTGITRRRCRPDRHNSPPD